MLRLLLALAMGGASSACALAAVGWVLYAHSPALVWVLQVFAAYGFLAGLACGALHLHFQGRPAAAPAALPADALAALVRAAMASAAAERQARPGSAADRRPVESMPATPAIPATAQPETAKADAQLEASTP